MAGLIRKIKEDGKVRRMAAAWLGICLVAQMMLGSLGALSTYADDTIYQVITVKESEIMKGVEKSAGKGPEHTPDIEDKYLPFSSDELKEEARNTITPFLIGTSVVHRQKLTENCAAIVAVSGEELAASGSEAEYAAENVIFIGLNGNKNKDCVFTLQIVDADDIVIRSMTIITYRQSGAATSSEATESKATGSEATPSEENEDPATSSTATASEATGSEVWENGFVETGSREELGEEELEDFVQKGESATPGEPATPDGTADAKDAAGPKMTVPAGGIGVAYAESGTNARGKVAQVKVFFDGGGDKTSILSGAVGTFHIAADYSVVDDKLPEYAYFTVRFEVKDQRGNEYRNISGPESESNKKPISALSSEEQREWKAIHDRMEESEEYAEAAKCDDWHMIRAETNTYFYSAAARMALFGIQNGGTAITDLPMFFSFDNYITPIGSTITATPGILNREELKNAYESSAGPAHSGDAALIVGDAATLVSNAEFWWQNTAQTNEAGLGNLIAGTNVGNNAGEIRFMVSAKKDYKGDKGRLYTTGYTISDRIAFEGFSLDIGGYGLWTDTTGKNGELYLTKGNKKIKLIGLSLPGGYQTGRTEVTPMYENGDSSTNVITGFEIRYSLENGTLDQENAADMADIGTNQTPMNVYLGIGGLLKNAKDVVIYDELAAAAGKMPSVTSTVTFDAYSIMYDKNGDHSSPELNDGKTNHHSEAELKLTSKSAYPLEKKAYRDSKCAGEATGANKIFELGSDVYYKITVKNNGYSSEKFDIVDELPAGLIPSSVETLKVTAAGTELKKEEYTDSAADETRSPAVKIWGGIRIPSGREAVVIFKATVKDRNAFEKGISTTLINKAGWYRSTDTERTAVLGNDDAVVYVNLNVLTGEDISFQKSIVSGGNGEGSSKSVPVIGSDVTYNLHAEMAEGIANSHWITVKDNWPDGVTLKEISGIPARAIIVIKENGKEIKTYENTHDGITALSGLGLNNKKNITVEAKVCLSPDKRTANLKLKGTINVEGEIKNSAQVEGGEGSQGSQGGQGGHEWEHPDEVSFYAIGASIEKKAYYISAAQSDSITEDNSINHPVNQSVTFRAGDVVCYEMTLRNTGNAPFTATVSDDVSKLFGAEINPEFATANLGVNGSVFMKNPGEKKWEKLTPSHGGKAFEREVTLEKEQKVLFRIYLVIPDSEPGQEINLLPVNTVTAALTYAGKPDQKYSIDATASITINQNVQEASIEKEVYAVARELNTSSGRVLLEGANWKNKELGTAGRGYVPDEGTLKVGKGDYVFYRIEIKNDSREYPLKVYEAEDWLPAGMQLKYFYEFNGGDKKDKVPGEKAGEDYTLDLGPGARITPFSAGKWMYFTDSKAGGGWGTNAVVQVNHAASHFSLSKDKTSYRVRLYGDGGSGGGKTPSIPAGRSVVYGVIAQVTGDFDSGDVLTNETGVIVDQSTKTNEKFDKAVSELDGAIGGITYTDDLYKITTDSADVITTGLYTPGIEKNLAQYNVQGIWRNYTKDGKNDAFLPTSPMRWQVTLNNGTNAYMTRGPIESYTIRDTFPAGLTYNENDAKGSCMITSGGKTVTLPKPLLGQSGDKNVTASWTVEKQSGGYRITGAADAVVNTNLDLSIPVKGTVTLQVGSVAEGTAKYGTYVNQVDLIPADQYEYTEACAGTVMRDGEGSPASVRAEASVDIFFGDGRTEAWKEISGSFNGVEMTGNGRDKTGNSIIADAGSEIIYTLNIKNQVEKGIENLVIVDRLPEVKDNGLVNNMQRNSDFKVSFTSNPSIAVRVKKADKTTVELHDGDYTVSYADWNFAFGKGSALPSGYWEPAQNWSAGENKCWAGSSVGKDTLRIEIANSALQGLANEDTIVVTFDALLPQADELDLTRELIAWNTFGYAYRAVDSNNKTTITVEPAKVGVQIPTASLAVTKKVESRFEEDKNSPFTFSLEMEDGNGSGRWKSAGKMPYQLTADASENAVSGWTGADGEFTLSHGQTAKFTVLAGRGYRIAERDAEGYYVTVTDFDGVTQDDSGNESSLLFDPANPPSCVLEEAAGGKNYYCSFTNAKSSFFLPETGGAGTDLFRRKGAGMMLFSVALLTGCLISAPAGGRKKKEGRGEER